jgi:hypothetical protein
MTQIYWRNVNPSQGKADTASSKKKKTQLHKLHKNVIGSYKTDNYRLFLKPSSYFVDNTG